MAQENSSMADDGLENNTTASFVNPDSPSSKRIKLEESKKRWSNEEVIRLIELFEERTILWNVFDKEYCKRDKLERDVAFNDIAKELNIPILDVKAKLNTLRAQMGRELKKVRGKPKNGQAMDELNQSSWVYWKRLQFLAPVMLQTSKHRNENLSSGSILTAANITNNDDSIFNEDEEEPVTMIPQPKMEQKTISDSDEDNMSITTAEHHHTMMNETNRRPPSSTGHASSSIASPTPTTTTTKVISLSNSILTEVKKRTVSHFAAYVDEKLASFDKRNRAIAEKRITDILFEMEMASTPECNYSCEHYQQNPQDMSHDANYSSYRS